LAIISISSKESFAFKNFNANKLQQMSSVLFIPKQFFGKLIQTTITLLLRRIWVPGNETIFAHQWHYYSDVVAIFRIFNNFSFGIEDFCWYRICSTKNRVNEATYDFMNRSFLCLKHLLALFNLYFQMNQFSACFFFGDFN
jgi:hypothetical protein